MAEYFRLRLSEADTIIEDFRGTVSQWRTIVNGLRLSAREQDRMAGAFHLADG